VEGNWRYLTGIALPAFCLHTAFASLGTSDYRVLAQIWASHPPPSNSTFPAYSDGQSISGTPGTEIYNVLFATATRSLFTVSIASVVGSYLAIQTTDYFQRSRMLSIYSLILTMVLISIGSTIFAVSQTTLYRVTIVLYAVAQFIFSLGPSVLLFIIPAEIFPTRYRSTCYSLVLAASTIGSIIGEVTLSINSFGVRAYIIIIFSILPILAALFSWGWLPNIQYWRGYGVAMDRPRMFSRLRNKTLETLGTGAKGVGELENEPVIGFRRRFLRRFSPPSL